MRLTYDNIDLVNDVRLAEHRVSCREVKQVPSQSSIVQRKPVHLLEKVYEKAYGRFVVAFHTGSVLHCPNILASRQ